eukprot:CAMPEP_0177645734 /NCGR_PEP_ID=MMETSP0447-20121125/9404_1 /TAXON_ID=0 /ORGANISM="Stygamoeba regulata, Strain BSH-02190019" /LENGTH=824 /DNA_ID=CAMNT_0019148231 /DNA_START=190 /DNA_END=2664 /DNA_ORIENTATION=+
MNTATRWGQAFARFAGDSSQSQLALDVGQVVELTQDHGNGWWTARTIADEPAVGYVPGNHLHVLDSPPSALMPSSPQRQETPPATPTTPRAVSSFSRSPVALSSSPSVSSPSTLRPVSSPVHTAAAAAASAAAASVSNVILPEGWKVATSSDGGVYYYHAVTRQSSWDLPPGSRTISSEEQQQQQQQQQSSPRAPPQQVSPRAIPPAADTSVPAQAPLPSPRTPRTMMPAGRGGRGGSPGGGRGAPPYTSPMPRMASSLSPRSAPSPLSNGGALPPLNTSGMSPRVGGGAGGGFPSPRGRGGPGRGMGMPRGRGNGMASPRGPPRGGGSAGVPTAHAAPADAPPPLPAYTRASSGDSSATPAVAALPPPPVSALPPAIAHALPPPLSKAGSAPGLLPTTPLPPPLSVHDRNIARQKPPLLNQMSVPSLRHGPAAQSSSNFTTDDIPSRLNHSASSAEAGEKWQRMRIHALREIVETETDYVNDLNIVVNVFLFPLKQMKVLPEADLDVIFSNLETLEPIHKNFSENLENRWDEAQQSATPWELAIGDVFAKFAHYFKLYSVYCTNQPQQFAKLDECKLKVKAFQGFLDICHSDDKCKGLFINSFLIKPIQRLCKYPLLLRELIEHTPETHPDYSVLISSKEKIEEVVSSVNDEKRKVENLAKMQEIEKRFGLEGLAVEERTLHREGLLKLYVKKGKPLEDRYLFLFNDTILVMKPRDPTQASKMKKLSMSGRVALDKTKIINISDDEEFSNAFELALGKQTYLLCAPNEAIKNQWVKDIKTFIKEFQKQVALQLYKERGPSSNVGRRSGSDIKKDKKSKGSRIK